MMENLRLVVASDDPLARAGLAALLAETSDHVIVGQLPVSGISGDLEADIDSLHPDVIVWDLGWETAETLPEQPLAGYPVLALVPDEILITALWAAGVRALLLRQQPVEALLAAIEATARGLTVLTPELARNLIPQTSSDELADVEALTPRELEVLQHLAEGLTNRAIAQRLDITEHTVKFHVNAVLNKLGAQSRTDAVVRAMRLGLIVL